MMENIAISWLAALVLAASAIAQEAPRSPVPVPPAPPSLPPGKQAPGVTDIWVVFKTHCDLGYTDTAEHINTKYREPMMDHAIRLIEADRAKPADERFKWSIAGWPMARNILGPQQTPERRVKIETALREGSMNVHALPATLHSEAMDIEDYVRALGFSSRIARAYGQPLPIAGKMTDVPGHCWFLPTLLHHAGVRFLQIGCNYSNRPVLLPHLFWWEGADGSRILCNYTPHYGSEVTPPRDWPARNYLAVQMTHDNEGPPSPNEVAQARAAAAKTPGARLHLGTLDDFAKAVLAENPELPVLRGDMVDAWIHGISSMPAESAAARVVRPLLPALDLLDTQLRAWGLGPAPLAAPLAEAYENSMLYGEHTWGPVTPGWGVWSEDAVKNRGTERYLYGDAFRKARAAGYYHKFERSFDDHRAFIRRTERIAGEQLAARMTLLAGAVKTDRPGIVVFNPLPWPRTAVVEAEPGRFLLAADVPANGYKTFPLDAASAPERFTAGTPVVDTRFFKATFDLKRGGISSLVEKATGRELVDPAAPHALGQFLHERFSAAQTWDYYHRYATMNNCAWGTVKPNMPGDVPYAAVTPGAWTLTAVRSATAATVTLTAGDTLGLAKGCTLEFSFPADTPALDIAWNVTDKSADPLPEGGWLCFPFAVKDARFTVGRLGGPIDLAKDPFPGGNRHLFGVHTGTAVTGRDGAGAALCSPDAPTMSFGAPGLWKYTFDYLPTNGSVFVHLYNNMWNTNFPDWIEGSWRCRVRVWPIANGESTTRNLAVRSWEARLPMRCALTPASRSPQAALPPAQAGLTLARPAPLVTAFGGNPDGPGTLLRVWEQAGEAGDLTVTLPAGCRFGRATPVNLRGETAGPPIPIHHRTFRFPLSAFAPASFVLN